MNERLPPARNGPSDVPVEEELRVHRSAGAAAGGSACSGCLADPPRSVRLRALAAGSGAPLLALLLPRRIVSFALGERGVETSSTTQPTNRRVESDTCTPF